MGTLELQIADDVVFAYYRRADAGPCTGGYLGLVYADGHFKGVGFDELQALGTGRHAVALDERVRSELGQEPRYESEWQRLFARFEFSLFMHRVGACVALEVLAVARDIIQLESQEQRRVDPG